MTKSQLARMKKADLIALVQAKEGTQAGAKAKATVLKVKAGVKQVERVDGPMQYGIGHSRVWFAGKDGVVRKMSKTRFTAAGAFKGAPADAADPAKWAAAAQVFAR